MYFSIHMYINLIDINMELFISIDEFEEPVVISKAARPGCLKNVNVFLRSSMRKQL